MNAVTQGGGDADAAQRQPLDVMTAVMRDGTSIVVRRMSAHAKRRVIMSHGNGLAINGYEEFWSRILPWAEVILFDFRNHGVNPPATPSAANNWVNFVADMDEVLAAVEERFGPKETYGFFHSMSALTCLIHASTHDAPWKGLVLFEPPAVPSSGQERDDTLSIHRDLSARTRKRKTEFQNPEQLSQSFSRLLMFQRMPEQARLQLAAATLRPDGQGAYRLCCPPDFEADTFNVAELRPHWDGFHAIKIPVLILSSAAEGSDMPILSRISERLSKEFGFDLIELPDTAHLLMLDEAERCAGLARDFVRRVSGDAEA